MATTTKRVETFAVQDGYLVRNVVPRCGHAYVHRCSRATFEQVAHAVEEHGPEGFTLDELVEAEGLPFTQVAVALAFLRERGIVETRYRRDYPATTSTHLDAMTEFCALADDS